MATNTVVTELLTDLKKAERIADYSLLIPTIRELGTLGENAEEAIPLLLSIFTHNYDVPAIRDALKTTFQQIGFDISGYEPFGKVRLLTRLLLLFGLIQLNGVVFAWGALHEFPFDYLSLTEGGPMFVEILTNDQVVIAQGNYYWVLAAFLTTTVYYMLYLVYSLYLTRSFPTFPTTYFKSVFGLIIPLLGVLFGIISIEQTMETWVIFSSKMVFQQLLVLGFLSSFWSLLINVQLNSFVNGYLKGVHDKLHSPSLSNYT